MASLRAALLRVMAALTAIATPGCADEALNPVPAPAPPEPPAPEPTLALRVSQPPARLSGLVSVEVEASPPEAFAGVELRLDQQVFATLVAPPFAAELGSAGFPDGPATIRATGVLAASAGTIEASLDVELANFPPALEVLAPADGEVLIGSPSQGFALSPVVIAEDGNGILRIEADAGAGPVDIGAGDGSVAVPLPAGTEFPHAPVPVTFSTEDSTGAVTERTIEVVPTNLVMRLEAPVGGGALGRVEALDGGAIAFDIGSVIGAPGGVYAVPGPAVPAEATLAVENARIIGRAGGELLLRAQESNGARVLRGSVDTGEITELISLSYDYGAQQAMGFGPLLHSSGRLHTSWLDYGSFETHLLAFAPDGTPLFDAVYPGAVISGAPFEAPDGRLLAAMGPPQAPIGAYWLQPVDPDTGALLQAWAPPVGNAVLREADGLLLHSTSQGGSPPYQGALTWRLFPDGAPSWSQPIGTGTPYRTQRLPDGDVLTFIVDGYSGGDGPRLLRVGPGGAAVLWAPAPGELAGPVGFTPGGSDLYVGIHDIATSASRLGRLGADGVMAWTRPGSSALLILQGGDVLAREGADMVLLSGAGEPRWSAALPPEADIEEAAEHGDLILLAYGTGAGQPFFYEALDRASGARRWRYSEGPASASYAHGAVVPVPAWGALLATIVPEPASSFVVVGLLP